MSMQGDHENAVIASPNAIESATPEELHASVALHIESYSGPVLVAFSGGVDSSVVACAARRALGRDKVLCVTARSESTTEEDIELCAMLAAEHDLPWDIIDYSELAIPGYAENPVNRCYFCKSELYKRLGALHRPGYTVLDGSNLDDVGDYRPGMKAVAENGVRSPLREAGFRKKDIRVLARYYGLPNHDRPSSPCLSSRIPYGDPITREKLEQVAKAEAFLRSLGIPELRCRHHGKVARIEVPVDRLPDVMLHREAIVAELRRVGFVWVSVDLAGFMSGSLNAVLKKDK